jgi:hypothetical protein
MSAPPRITSVHDNVVQTRAVWAASMNPVQVVSSW